MKYCEKCNKGFTDEKVFCPECGSKLIPPLETDIFGDPIERKHNKQVIYDENKNVYDNKGIKNSPYKDIVDKNYELFSLLSIGFMFMPIYGIILCGISLYKNLNHYNETKKGFGYLLLTLIALVVSLIFTYLLYKNGILTNVMDSENI